MKSNKKQLANNEVVISKTDVLSSNGRKLFRANSPYKDFNRVVGEEGEFLQLVNRHGKVSHFLPRESVLFVDDSNLQ